MNKDSKIYVSGHKGLVGSKILKLLKRKGYTNLIYKTSTELDLRNQQKVKEFFKDEQPEYIFIASAKVGGIKANSEYMADFLYNNLMIQNNLIHFSYKFKVKKLLFLGSSCIYPKNSPQPIKEEYLLNGKLEPTNEGFAIAKISGIKLCEYYRKQYGCDFISLIPANTYGEGDHFRTRESHVVSALITKIYDAKLNGNKDVYIWGSGKPKRELLYVDDLAEGCLFMMKNYSQSEFVNIGTGKDISILELAELIADIIGYRGNIFKDITKPDGMPRKLLDITKINDLGWLAKISLREGLKRAIKYYENNYLNK